MTKSEQPAQINGVDIGEVTINALGPSPSVSAKYAFVNAETGVRYGAGTRLDWSAQTMQKLQDLLLSMEADICVHVFGDAIVQTEVTSKDFNDVASEDEIPSL